MRKLLFLFLLLHQLSQAATIYVRVDGPNGDGGSDATAWNLDKLNATQLAAGSTVLIRRGDVFSSGLVPQSNVTYSAYGTGAVPLFSGLKTLGAWTLSTGNIYYTSIDAGSELNVVLLDGKLRGMGRYPKTGFLSYSGHSPRDKIWGAAIPAIPFDPTGAEVVLRKIRQVTSRFLCTRSADTLKLTADFSYQTNRCNNNTFDISNGFGFFIQNSLATLTTDGDWYYDSNQKRLYMYFSGDPSSRIVRAAGVTNLMQVSNLSGTTFQSLGFEGANFALFLSYNSDHIQFIDCVQQYAKNALNCETNTRSLTVRRGAMRYLVDNGVFVSPNSATDVVDSIRVDSVSMYSIGTIIGMGASGDGHQLANWILGNHLWVTRNVIDNVGYHGIVAHGNYTTVEYNRITRFGLTKDDVGGVYDFQQTGTSSVGQVIRYNYIANATGLADGTVDNHAEGFGVYIDADVTGTEVAYNTILNIGYAGLMFTDAEAGQQVHHNTMSGCGSGLQIYKSRVPLRSFSFHHNKVVATAAGQVGIHLRLNTSDDLSQMGQFFANEYYCIDRLGAIKIGREYAGNAISRLNLTSWQTFYGLDKTSKSNPNQSLSPAGKRYRTAGGAFYIFNN